MVLAYAESAQNDTSCEIKFWTIHEFKSVRTIITTTLYPIHCHGNQTKSCTTKTYMNSTPYATSYRTNRPIDRTNQPTKIGSLSLETIHLCLLCVVFPLANNLSATSHSDVQYVVSLWTIRHYVMRPMNLLFNLYNNIFRIYWNWSCQIPILQYSM